MDGTQIVDGLDFPEGPVWLDGVLWFTEITGGHLSRWTAAGGVERVGATGGGPNGATAGRDGWIYVTQNGGHGPRAAGHARHPAGGGRRDGRGRRHGDRRHHARRAQRPRLRRRRSAVLHRSARRLRSVAELQPGPAVRPRRRVRRRRAGRRAGAGLPERHRLPRRRHAGVDRVVHPAGHEDGRRHAGRRSSSCPTATGPTASASAPTAGCTSPRPTPTACRSSRTARSSTS